MKYPPISNNVPPTSAVHPIALELIGTLLFTDGRKTKKPLTTHTAEPRVKSYCQRFHQLTGYTKATHQEMFQYSTKKNLLIRRRWPGSRGCRPFLWSREFHSSIWWSRWRWAWVGRRKGNVPWGELTRFVRLSVEDDFERMCSGSERWKDEDLDMVEAWKGDYVWTGKLFLFFWEQSQNWPNQSNDA